MSLSEDQAISIALKCLKDLGYGTDGFVDIKATYREEDDFLQYTSQEKGPAVWDVTFTFECPELIGALPQYIFISIKDEDGIAYILTQKHRTLKLEIDEKTGKYIGFHWGKRV